MSDFYKPSLYQKEKYKVLTGTDTNISLCTCWTDPLSLEKKYSKLREEFSIVGTLYSREGVSILIRNLCLNPSINTVVVWAHDPLSKTAIGSAGRSMLQQVWDKGVDEEGIIPGAGEKIHKEIQQEAVEQLRKHVTIVDYSDLTFDELLSKITHLKLQNTKPYMTPRSFPEPKKEKILTMPSEKTNWSIRGKTITDTWLKVVDRVIRYGDVKKTEYGGSQKELHAVNWTITAEDIDHLQIPDWPESLRNIIGLDQDMLYQYKDTFLNAKKPEGSSYTYGNRLHNYLDKTNQIQKWIEKLKENPVSRRAYATTFYPPVDLDEKSPPCLTQVQVLTTSDNKLNMFASFRSHDIFKAAIPNAYGLLNLLSYICNKTNYEQGSLTISSVSAHIYEEDWPNATDLVKCALWKRTKLYFDENEDIDPRGIVRIEIKNNMLHIELQSLNGDLLWEYDARSAREGILKIARLNLLSKNEHYADIAIELVKAEIALKKDIEYVQDKPLIVDKVMIK